MAGDTKPVVKKRTKYLTNKELLAEVYASKKQKKMTNELAGMLMKLCAKYAQKPNFAGYPFIDDMQAYALYMLVRTWDSFDPKKSGARSGIPNPFAYYTQCIDNSFRQYLKQEKRQRNTRDELLIDIGLNPSHTYMSEYEEGQRQDRAEYNTSDNYDHRGNFAHTHDEE